MSPGGPSIDELGRLRGLAAWADALAGPDFQIGDWHPSWQDEAGVLHLGWFELSEDAERFTGDLGRLGWVRPFPWMDWLETPRGTELAASPDAIAEATAEELANLLTAIVRSERFGDGSIEGAHRTGLFLAAARRAAALAEALETTRRADPAGARAADPAADREAARADRDAGANHP